MELAANTAASAIQNTRLFSQLKRRVDQLSALHAVDATIGSTTDLRVSLQSVLENIIRQLRVDAAAILLLNPSTLVLKYSASASVHFGDDRDLFDHREPVALQSYDFSRMIGQQADLSHTKLAQDLSTDSVQPQIPAEGMTGIRCG